jgi:stage II sporulation protein D
MSKAVRSGGDPKQLLAATLVGLIALSGIGVAVTLTSCEASSGGSHGARKTAPKDTVAHRSSPALPNMDVPSSRAPSEPDIRIRILTAVDGVKVNASGGVLVGQGDPKGSVALPSGAKTDRRGAAGGLSIVLKGGQWLVTELPANGALAAGAPAYSYPASASLVLQPSGGSTQLMAVNTGLYGGALRLTARTDQRDGVFDVVEFVGIEDYLPGVVAKEMLTSWPLAAYQAQAVAARTYAMHERERSLTAGLAFDVESSDRDQVYGGSTTNANAREAVRTTRGIVMMDGDKVLRAYFSSTCGGRTAAAKDTWPIGPGFEYNLAAPIQEHHRDFACSASPLFRWSVERPRNELAQRIRIFGEKNGLAVKRLKDLKSIEVMASNTDGRPSRFKVIEPGGAWYQLSGEEMRLACNTNASGVAVATLPTPVPPLAAATADTAIGFGLESAAAAEQKPPTLPDITRATRVNSSDFEVKIVGDKAVITGRGFGHGVGLCQYCAKGFAERGENWRTMIERFYPGAKIVSEY